MAGIDQEPLTDEEYESAVGSLTRDACSYVETALAPERDLATACYRGDAFPSEYLDEDSNAYRIVMTEVRDNVQNVLPDLHRIFDPSKKMAEATPRSPLEVKECQDKTAALNYVFRQNEGFTILNSAFKDALIRKHGWFMWWIEAKNNVQQFTYKNWTKDMVDTAKKAMKGDWDFVSVTENDDDDDAVHPDEADHNGDRTDTQLVKGVLAHNNLALPDELKTFTVVVNRKTKKKANRVCSLPCDQVFWNADAPSVAEATIIGRRQLATVSDLVALGYDRAEIEDHSGTSDVYSISATNDEAFVRNPGLQNSLFAGSADKSMDRVKFYEAFVRIDKDGDGIAELRRICMVGEGFHILEDEIWEDEEAPFAYICPDPEPHTMTGASLADKLLDIQRIKSSIINHTLDSLAASIHPRIAYVEGAVNADDLENTDPGGVIRIRGNNPPTNYIQELTTTFQGQAVLPVLAYFDDIVARRTGISPASQGLNDDVLQSTTAAAVTNTITAGQDQAELIARIFSEMGLKKMFRGLLRQMIRHADPAEPLQVPSDDGQFSTIDLSQYSPDTDIIINLGLGRGKSVEKLSILSNTYQQQVAILTAQGLDNPLVGPLQLYATLTQMLQLGEFPDVNKFWKLPDPSWQPQQRPDPNQAANQLQMQAMQLDAHKAQQQHDQAMLKMSLEAAIKKLELEQARELKIADMETKYHTQINSAAINAHASGYEAEVGAIQNLMTGAQTNDQANQSQAAQQSMQAAMQQAQHQHDATQGAMDRAHELNSQVIGHVANMAQAQDAPPDPEGPPPGEIDDGS